MKHIKEIKNLLLAEDYESAITVLERYCTNNPSDLDAKFDLALLFENTAVYADGFMMAQDILDDIIKKDEKAIKAIILKAYIEDTHNGEIDNDTLNKIEKSINLTDDDSIKSQLFLLKALFFSKSNPEYYLNNLKHSINFDPKSSKNQILIGRALKSMGVNKDGIQYIQEGLKNIQKVYPIDYQEFTPLNFEEFINENIRGIYITYVNYESLKNEINNWYQ